MKRTCMLLLTALLLAVGCGLALAEEADEARDEWTVMFYLCGSDLESRYSYASGNLEEIAGITKPDNLLPYLSEAYDIEIEREASTKPGRVNVLIETGGSKEWHAQALGLDIDRRALQRWRYNIYSQGGKSTLGRFELMETLPLKSMAESETLSDFIRWGAETCPAKKYALVLWGHGDGALTGMFTDELFKKDIMYIYELKQALSDAGTQFEAVVIDACLMSNMETAWALKDHAKWMVASEEIVPGKGTAIGEWLQELVYYPGCDGEWLGRCVCDTTAVKYANDEDQMAEDILTWAVIDLSKVDALIDYFSRFINEMCNALRESPELASIYMRMISGAVEYGDGMQNMRDIGSVLYNRDLVYFWDASLRNAAVQALADAVVYCVSGQARREARGLTFCFPGQFDDETMKIYAQNFPLPKYLAYLDAVSEWTAPEWVYETMERLPKIEEIEEFQMKIRRTMSQNGLPGVMIQDAVLNLERVYYSLYRLDERTGTIVSLGRTECHAEITEEGELLWRANDPLHWPSIEGELINIELIKSQEDVELYSVPVTINDEKCLLRCGRTIILPETGEGVRTSDYEIYGIWVGYDAESTLMNRNVKPLSAVAGQEYRLLYPIDGSERRGKLIYEPSRPMTLYRGLDVTEIPLPAGTYYMQYEIEDVYMRKATLDRIEFQYDGQQMTLPKDDEWHDDDWVNLTDHNRG